MKITGIEHVGIAQVDIESKSDFWQTILGIADKSSEVIAEQGVKTDIYDTGKGKIELLEALDDNSPIARYINKKGRGIHHICLAVEDIDVALSELKEAGIELIDHDPRVGAEGLLIAFIHPRSTGGILVELAQKP